MSAPVTRRHREGAASAVYAGGAAVTAWIKSGRVGARLDPDLPRIAQALADIEAEAIASVAESTAVEGRHLEYGARFLSGMLKRAETEGVLVPEAKAWLEAERARNGGR